MATIGKRLIFSGAMTLEAVEAPTADATIKPGMSVVHTATALAKNSNADTVFGYPHLFADYDMLHAGSVDDTYASGANLIARELTQGEKANVLVAASNNLLARGVALASNGDGTLKIAATDDTDYVLAYSDEIINVTGSAALVRVRGA